MCDVNFHYKSVFMKKLTEIFAQRNVSSLFSLF